MYIYIMCVCVCMCERGGVQNESMVNKKWDISA